MVFRAPHLISQGKTPVEKTMMLDGAETPFASQGGHDVLVLDMFEVLFEIWIRPARLSGGVVSLGGCFSTFQELRVAENLMNACKAVHRKLHMGLHRTYISTYTNVPLMEFPDLLTFRVILVNEAVTDGGFSTVGSICFITAPTSV